MEQKKHRTGLMVLLGFLAGFASCSIFLSGQGPDAGIAFPFFFPFFALPFIVLFISIDRYIYSNHGGISNKMLKIGFTILALLALLALDIYTNKS